jgi:hypothetical protein
VSTQTKSDYPRRVPAVVKDFARAVVVPQFYLRLLRSHSACKASARELNVGIAAAGASRTACQRCVTAVAGSLTSK